MDIVTLATSPINDIIGYAKNLLKKGGVVVVPSDTVYGIAVDPTNEAAVGKLIKFKERPPGKAISVFCGTIERVKKYVRVSQGQEKLINRLLPGPYTLVLPSRHKVSSLIEAENGTLGVRVPDYNFTNSLVNAYGTPLTATSANRANQSPHYSIKALLHSLSEEKKQLIDLIIDAGKLPVRKPSTVIDCTVDSIRVLREGDFNAHFSTSLTKVYHSDSEEDTKRVALALIKSLYKETATKPLIIFLIGNLGAGKTVFTKAMAAFLGVTSIVSPTFVIYYEYEATKKPVTHFIHADLYRLQETAEFTHLGLEEYIRPGHILCIEWAEKSSPIMESLMQKATCVQVKIDYSGPTARNITISL